MKKPVLLALLLSSALAFAQSAIQPLHTAGMTWIFDWDDNIAFMPTKIFLFGKDGKEVGITTREYAHERLNIDKGVGKYAGYKIRNDAKTGSFRRFEDAPGANYFLEDIQEMIKKGGTSYQAPSWKKMVEALSSEYSAKQFFVLTAREQSRDEIFEGLKYLQKIGVIKYLPPIENLYSGGDPRHPSEEKAKKIVEHLDRLNMNTPTANFPKTLDPDGKKQVQTNIMGFSDDDWGNFTTVLAAVQEGVKAKRWPNVKVFLKYTGDDPRGKNDRNIVIKSDGSTRVEVEGENNAFHLLEKP